MKLDNWSMLDALRRKDYPAAISQLQQYFGINLSIDTVNVSPDLELGAGCGVEIITGDLLVCAWFQSEGFWDTKHTYATPPHPEQPVTAQIWETRYR